jgi:hypothetical protein
VPRVPVVFPFDKLELEDAGQKMRDEVTTRKFVGVNSSVPLLPVPLLPSRFFLSRFFQVLPTVSA